MAGKLLLEIITPDRLVLREEVDMVVATAKEGEFGVLPGHAPFLCLLEIGPGRYKKDGKTEYISIVGGICEVFENKVTILTEAAELAREIDIERAMRARERALRRLRQRENIDIARAEAALRRAIMRLKVAHQAGLIESIPPASISE
ncbi:MAG TPA: F0F1 ATP synthase subunit epsilon [Candidatus Desulfofervidus auxilii]|uniref:ATP synthase epsilon chain n=1 Tax=Desulfofervidus auxilii TaxID=1621989 RepID=A0A7C0YBI3_DESA2|nr:F0F1 ATP synthase subunit epsilon [Candidatus Desulfofervidus auxilii]